MAPTFIELVPNRQLLDSNFDGYKLSLKEIPCKRREFPVSVDRVLLGSNQYSILHAKLFGLHNHLIGDPFDDIDSVYFFDTDWTLCKTYIDPFCEDLVGPILVWHIPRQRPRKTGDYNVSLKFVNKDIAVVGDGTGLLYILNTGNRKDDDTFEVCFFDEVAGNDEPFVIADATCKLLSDGAIELHVLLLSLKQQPDEEHYISIIHWITLSKIKDKEWTQIALRQLHTKGHVQYAAIEKECESVYVVSDSSCCQIVLNSENPVVSDKKDEGIIKVYTWSQNLENITLSIPLKENANKNLVSVKAEALQIEIKYGSDVLVKGELYQRINPDLTTWDLVNNALDISVFKNTSGDMWPDFIKDDQTGEYVLDASIVEQVHERLAHLSSDTQSLPQTGTTFNTQQVEECDFENDKSTSTFVRLCGKTNQATHKINLGSHQVLMNASLTKDAPLALGVRHDIDVCLWQPNGCQDKFDIVHAGTLLAFGYVQASKANRKFLCCPPDMSYAVICETTKHIFLYRQQSPVASGELRNRSTGRRIQNIAEQQVVSLSNDEILGVYATNSTLFILTTNSVVALKLNS